jgi:predicted nucleic acid-binding protein
LKKYVIDANILFSAIIGSRRVYLELIKNVELYAPDYILKEIEKYEQLLLKKTKLTKKELNDFLIKLFKGVTILPSIIMNRESKQKAMDLCKDIDEKDTPYVALAIEMDVSVISNDKKLYKGLKEKGFSNIILLEDIINNMKKTGN